MGITERIEKNKVKFTFTVSPERFREGLIYSYNKNKSQINLDGFRKGKAPRKIIERIYGKDFFYNDAINFILPDAYEAACDENELEPVYRPNISLEEADEETGVSFVAEVFVKPEVEIDDYYGIPYPKTDTTPTESDIQEKMQEEREKNARQVSVDRPAEKGDMVTINFTGYVDGEPFEGGSDTDFDLVLGTNTFIDTFEDQLIGHVPGDDVKVNVTFPDDYNHENLAGANALFEVEVLDVKEKEYPELNDEFAQDVSEFDTLAEYRNDLTEKIKEIKEVEAKNAKIVHVMDQLVQKCKMEPPEIMYTARLEEMMQEFNTRLRMQGMNLPMYLQFTNQTEEQLKDTWSESAHKDINGRLALEAVMKKENFEVTQEEFKTYLMEMSDYSEENADDYIEKLTPNRRKDLEYAVRIKKAQDLVLEKAVAIESTTI